MANACGVHSNVIHAFDTCFSVFVQLKLHTIDFHQTIRIFHFQCSNMSLLSKQTSIPEEKACTVPSFEHLQPLR